MNNFFGAVAVLVGFVMIVVIAGLIFAIPTWLLWNYCLVDAVTVVKEITWLQAWGINVLFGLLFKSTPRN